MLTKSPFFYNIWAEINSSTPVIGGITLAIHVKPLLSKQGLKKERLKIYRKVKHDVSDLRQKS